MRAVIQRVNKASVRIEDRIKASIGPGLLILLGIEETDTPDDLDWLCNKVVNLRIFNDDNGLMNLSVKDEDGDIIVVSQFTLHARTRKGNRPSYTRAAHPDIAIPLYNKFIESLETLMSKKIGSGEFGAMMDIDLVNSGPVTIIIDTKNRE